MKVHVTATVMMTVEIEDNDTAVLIDEVFDAVGAALPTGATLDGVSIDEVE